MHQAHLQISTGTVVLHTGVSHRADLTQGSSISVNYALTEFLFRKLSYYPRQLPMGNIVVSVKKVCPAGG